MAELPDRSSPEDWPEAMLVTHDELARILRDELGEAVQGQAPSQVDLEKLVAEIRCACTVAEALMYARAILTAPGQAPPESSRTPEWGVTNCHVLARRRLVARDRADSELVWWEHVKRICEEAGATTPGVLRKSLPTEITEGGQAPPSPPPAEELQFVEKPPAALGYGDCCVMVLAKDEDGYWSRMVAYVYDRAFLARIRGVQGPAASPSDEEAT